MWRLTVFGRMAASTLIVTALCATVVQVNGQCERCGFLLLSCCVEDDYQFPTTTVTSTVSTTTTQHQTHTVTATVHLTETQILTTTATQHSTVTSTELTTTTITGAQPPSTITSTATETVTATTTETQLPSTVTSTATQTVTATTTETQLPSTVTSTATQTVTATTTETQLPSIVTSTESATATTTEQATSIETLTKVETVSEVVTQSISQTVTDTLNLILTITKTAILNCSTSSWLAAESDCRTLVTTLTEFITASESPFCSGQALDTITTGQSNIDNAAIAAIILAIILVLAAVVCSVSWVVCLKTSRKKKDHMLNPVHLMGVGADTRSTNGGSPLSVRNPVYATIDTPPSITAGMAELQDDDLPGYCTVETLAQDGRSSVKYVNVPRSKPGMNETDDLAKSPMNEHNGIISANMATVESIYSTDEDKYWVPAATLEELRKQQVEKRLNTYYHIEPQHVSLSSPLGEGEFGAVYKGVWTSENGSMEVAVKTLHCKEDTSTVESNGQVELLKEAAVMGQFNHTNVVGLHGVVDTTNTVMLVMEFMAGGNLKSYLDCVAESPLQVDPPRLLRWCQDIASGMSYLSSKGFIHRDLAARNILRSGKDQCKIADFGLSRDLEQDYYYKPKGGRIPVRWTAPEAILYRKYTTKSDVWSYGMVMYEVWSLGHKPFETWEVSNLVNALGSGFCHAPPPGCPRGVYYLMVQCWNPDYHQRVSFNTLTAQLSESPTSLLAWTKEDEASAPQASVLGAPLEEAAHLYQDLQKLYNGT